MILLSIETSSARGSLALFREEEPIAEAPFPEGLVHGREITVHLAEMMDRLGLAPRELGAVAVGIGPGSYTGIRVGVTAAKTLAFALKVPVIAVSSLQAIAANALRPDRGGVQVVTAVDGKQRHVYLARYRVEAAPPGSPPSPVRSPGERVVCEVEERVLSFPVLSGGVEVPGGASPGSVREALAEVLLPNSMVVGDAADLVIETAGLPGVVRGPREYDWPLAKVVGFLAIRAAALERLRFDPEAVHRLTPIYLRGSTAEKKLGTDQSTVDSRQSTAGWTTADERTGAETEKNLSNPGNQERKK